MEKKNVSNETMKLAVIIAVAVTACLVIYLTLS
jgi:hypothetical protein